MSFNILIKQPVDVTIFLNFLLLCYFEPNIVRCLGVDFKIAFFGTGDMFAADYNVFKRNVGYTIVSGPAFYDIGFSMGPSTVMFLNVRLEIPMPEGAK